MSIHRGHLGFVTRLVAGALLCALVAPPSRAGDSLEFEDNEHDAVIRRTDSCNCHAILPGQNLPDIYKITISGWDSPTPDTNPYNGCETSSSSAHLVRIDVTLRGLINPPGTIGLNGLPFDPFQFGNNPLFGFIEFDIDNDKDTGGDLQPDAAVHYLGNAARFGGRPAGPIGARAASGSGDLFHEWTHPPEIQLSGTDWLMTFCGCFSAVPVYKSDPGEATFGPGATWIMSGRFFQRASAYRAASLMIGGSQPGAYDPMVQVRFQHSISEHQTIVTLVYALDAVGAGQLVGAPPQSYRSNVTNQTSIAEGISELISRAASGGIQPVSSLAFRVTNRWSGRSTQTAIDVSRWKPSFIVGTSFSEYAVDNDALYVWTDVGFDARRGDLNGDGDVDALDRVIVQSVIDENDASPSDGDDDPIPNGSVKIRNFGAEYSLFDVNGDGFVDGADLAIYAPTCAADFDHSGSLSTLDIFAFLNAWFEGESSADFDHVDGLAVQDIFAFLSAWFAGC